MFDWNDLKAFLAVARGGSTLAASKALGVNQTTVARRIESLEQALGLKLFERGQTGSRLTEAGTALIADAEGVEQAAIRFANQAAQHLRGVAGALRLTTNELVASSMVIPALVDFRKAHPDIQVDLLITDATLDLQNGEADLAIRTSQALEPSDLVARKICDHDLALYCSRDYAARHGVPASTDDLKDHDLIDLAPELRGMPAATWMTRHSGGKTPVTRSNSIAGMVHAVKAGQGPDRGGPRHLVDRHAPRPQGHPASPGLHRFHGAAAAADRARTRGARPPASGRGGRACGAVPHQDRELTRAR